MKALINHMKHPVTKTLLALGCAGTLAATADAQLPTTYTAGDFLLGFREVGSTSSVVVDLGAIASFTSTRSYAINLGSTLTTQYGSGYATNANVFFSLSSTDSGDRTSYVTSPEYLTGVNAGPAYVWGRVTNTNALILQNKINAFGAEFTSRGQVQPNTDPDAYQNYMPGGTRDAGHATTGNVSYGFFNPTIEGNLGEGTSGVALDLIQLPAGSVNTPGNDLGIFQLSGDGNTLTFTPAALVPEPSSYAAAVLFGALAFLGFRMNKARKSSTKEQAA